MEMSEKIVIKPEYSAVGAKNPNKPSRAVNAAISIFRELKLSHIVEVGCGLLVNTPHILKAFSFVILVDTKLQYQRIKEKLDELSTRYTSFKKFIDVESFCKTRIKPLLDGAIVINVLHVLPETQQRLNLLKCVHKNLKRKGNIFIDVPHNETFYRNLVKTAKPYNDGYIMKRGKDYHTFYKNMTFEELKEYVEKAGFKFKQRIYLEHRITFISEKQ
ncbi:MAG: hypothetical protein DRI61_15480 [Chloroflexi bacterium]|nr:MAG: hypothetical protein DRI61_15480 [Chloroflexota bacterium]